MAETTETVSVTLRMPKDLLQIIEDRANSLGGKGKRSEVIITLIRKALDQPIPGITANLEKTEKLEERIRFLEERNKEFDEILEAIRQRLTQSDNERKELKTQTKELNNLGKEVQKIWKDLESIKENLSGLNSKIDKPRETRRKEPSKAEVPSLQLNITEGYEANTKNENQKEPEEKIVLSRELLRILKEQDPSRRWQGDTLRRYREGKKAQQWHTVGSLKFKFHEENQRATSKHNKYLWKMIYSSELSNKEP